MAPHRSTARGHSTRRRRSPSAGGSMWDTCRRAAGKDVFPSGLKLSWPKSVNQSWHRKTQVQVDAEPPTQPLRARRRPKAMLPTLAMWSKMI